MDSTLYYVVVISGLILAVGSLIMVVALRNAPEGFEGEEGFVGLTKGDEQLLSEFAAFRSQAMAQMGQSRMAA